MARPRKKLQINLTPGQASYVLDRLIAERHISAADVTRHVADMHREIGDLERRLHALKAATGGAAATPAAAPRRGRPGRRPGRKPAAAPAAAVAKKPRRTRITAEQRASRVLQGRYLGLIRQIPANRRGQYQRIAKEKGREAAIKELATALGK